MNVENSSELSRRIGDLKREKNAVILAHYYTTPEVQAVADFLGDSLALSVRAQSVDADIILFAGVHFMAETAKVLCPEKKVRGGIRGHRFLPHGGCLRQRHPGGR